jgi:hypothetical protein
MLFSMVGYLRKPIVKILFPHAVFLSSPTVLTLFPQGRFLLALALAELKNASVLVVVAARVWEGRRSGGE